jgi:hypothetical protein
MNIATSIRSIVVAVTAAGIVASSALAAGEPKNGYPFTRVVGSDRASLAMVTHLSASHALRGEPKNVFPFTGR